MLRQSLNVHCLTELDNQFHDLVLTNHLFGNSRGGSSGVKCVQPLCNKFVLEQTIATGGPASLGFLVIWIPDRLPRLGRLHSGKDLLDEVLEFRVPQGAARKFSLLLSCSQTVLPLREAIYHMASLLSIGEATFCCINFSNAFSWRLSMGGAPTATRTGRSI